jgi:hypothetical protein
LQALCSSVGAHLVEIETKRENDFIKKELQQNIKGINAGGKSSMNVIAIIYYN